MSILKVINVQPKDIYITFEISLKNADLILAGLEQSKIEYDSSEPETVAAKEAVENLFKDFSEIIEGLKADGIRPDSSQG